LAAAEKLDSNNVDMLIHTSRHYFACDREPDQSLAYAQRAADVDRLNPWAVFHITQAYWHQFDYEAALRETDLLAERFPDYWLAVWSRWWILSDLERHEEALAVAETVMLLNSYNETKTCLAVSLARLGRIAEAQAIYDELADGGTYWAPAMRALLLVALGKHDAALDALEQAFDTRDTTLIGTLHTKSLLPLHESSRFWSLVDKLKQRPQVEALRKALGVA
jgi:tetratricopeptide (TPR) repeat protein